MGEFDLEYIASRRKELNISPSEMAEKLGFSNASVYWKYEHDVYKFKANVLPKLADALKCSINHFYA